MQAHCNLVVSDRDIGRHVDQIAEGLACLRIIDGGLGQIIAIDLARGSACGVEKEVLSPLVRR
jgi:hypothetical protein